MKKMVVCNWKMNPQTESDALELFSHTYSAAKLSKGALVVVAPPFPFISSIERRWGVREMEMRGESPIHLAAQDIFWERAGAYTGEVSPLMERELGVKYVIVGHSERRRALGETDKMVNKKLRKAFEYGLAPILCIGENERVGEDIPESVGEQLRNAVEELPELFLESLIVAYEPVWAISTTPAADPITPSLMHKAALYIKKVLSEMHGEGCGARARILYGGSVDEKNVSSFLNDTGETVAGVLVGSASLHRESIAKIIEVAGQAERS